MATTEEAMERVGKFGLYQKRALSTIYLSSVFSASTVVMASVFVLYVPPHRCFVSEIDDNGNFTSVSQDLPPINENELNSNHTPSEEERMLSRYIPIEKGPDGELKWSQCYRYETQFTTENTTSINRTVVACDIGWKYFVPSGVLTAAMEFDIVCDRSWQVPLQGSIQLFGVMMGSIGGGFFADKYGRRMAQLCSWILLCFSSVMCTFLPIWIVTYPFWFLVGACTITRATSGMVLINELAPSDHRLAASSLNMLACALCYMLLPLLNYLLQNWRHFMVLYTCLQLSCLFPIYCFVKESLAWLLQNSKHDEAEALLREIAKINKRKLERSEWLLQRNSQKLKENGELKSPPGQRRMSYIDFAKIAFLRKRLAIFATAWFAACMGYYGLSINTNNLGGNRFIACLLAGAVEVPGNFLCYITIKKMGGRKSFISLMTLSSLCLLSVPLLLEVNNLALITLSMMGKLFVTCTFSNMFVFTGDLFPTLLRNQAYGASSFLARFSGILVPFIIFLGAKYYKAIPYLIMGSVGLLSVLGMCFLPETKNLPLPDTIEEAAKQERFARCLCCCKRREEELPKTTVEDDKRLEMTC